MRSGMTKAARGMSSVTVAPPRAHGAAAVPAGEDPSPEAVLVFLRVEAFLAAGHVCSVMGYEEYDPIAAYRYEFEPTTRTCLSSLSRFNSGLMRASSCASNSSTPSRNRACATYSRVIPTSVR